MYELICFASALTMCWAAVKLLESMEVHRELATVDVEYQELITRGL
jgi:hypothetical protein